MPVKRGPTFAESSDRSRKKSCRCKGRVPLSADRQRTLASGSGSTVVKDIWSGDGRQARFDSSGRGGTRTFASKRPEVHAVLGEGRDDGEKKKRKWFQLTQNTEPPFSSSTASFLFLLVLKGFPWPGWTETEDNYQKVPEKWKST